VVGGDAIFLCRHQKYRQVRLCDDTKITGELKSANFGVTGNVGIRYQHNRNFFFIEAGGNYGFIAVQQNDAHGSNRIGAASVMAGYAFSF